MRVILTGVLMIILFIGGLALLLRMSGDVININFLNSFSTTDSDAPPQVSKNGELLLSTDGGFSWNNAVTNRSNTSFIIQDIYYYTEDTNVRMLAETNQGLYGSRNNGVDWTLAFGAALPQAAILDFDVDFSTYQATVFVATTNRNNVGAVFRSQDGGRSFRQVYIAPTSSQKIVGVKIDASNNSKVYVLLSDGSFLVSRDKGSSWEQYNSIQAPEQAQFRSLSVYSPNPSILFATTHNALYRSLNAGTSWQVIKAFTNSDIYSININAATEDIYIGTRNDIFHSSNRGTNFTQIQFLSQQNQFPITAIFVDLQNANTLYVASGATLYKTTNRGRSWGIVNVFEGLSHNINFFSINPHNLQLQYIGSNYYE